MFLLIGFSFLLVLLLFLFFKMLVKQSKQPSGMLGILMMKLWNKVYFPMVEWSLTLVDRSKTINQILDVGIGNGVGTEYIHKNFPKSALYGIDISKTAIKQAKQNTLDSAIHYEVKSIEQTNFAANQFDLIFAFQNHFHWSDLGQSLAELKRILAVNGNLIIACEYAKVKYYLPELTKRTNLEDLLAAHGLNLHVLEEKKGWILYNITHLCHKKLVDQSVC